MRILSIFLTLMVLIAGVLSCAEPIAEDPIQYNLTVSSIGGGSVTTPGEGTYTYEAGTVVELAAVPDECCEFVEWTGDTVANPDSASTSITMDAAKSVTAHFAQRQYNLTISSTGGGSVIAPGEGSFTYDPGTVVHLLAVPSVGHRFLEWSGDIDAIGDLTSAETTMVMHENYSVKANFRALYASSDPLIEGLWHTRIQAIDEQGRVYFTATDPLSNRCSISMFTPATGEAIRLIEHQDADIPSLLLDGQENVYYVLLHDLDPSMAQIRRLAPGEAESQILFSVDELNEWLAALAVDSSGNVYFVLQSGARLQFLPGSKLCRIPTDTTTMETVMLFEDSLTVSNISIADHEKVLYFTSADQNVARIYRLDLESEVLDTMLERTTEDFGAIVYLTTRADGELYYLYRQRTAHTDPVQFGYLELGRYTLEALETDRAPELLVADELDQAVWAYVSMAHHFFAVGDTGDVFFCAILYEQGLVREAPIAIFWFDPLTGSYVALVESTTEEVYGYTFGLDREGNVYYASASPGTICRIDR